MIAQSERLPTSERTTRFLEMCAHAQHVQIRHCLLIDKLSGNKVVHIQKLQFPASCAAFGASYPIRQRGSASANRSARASKPARSPFAESKKNKVHFNIPAMI